LCLLAICLVAAVTLALLSAFIERTGPDLVQYSNLCVPPALSDCYKPVLKGGFPVAFLFDSPGVSRERQLAFVEDELHVGALIADVAIYFVVLTALAWAFALKRSRAA
jgi:hypothetical protein